MSGEHGQYRKVQDQPVTLLCWARQRAHGCWQSAEMVGEYQVVGDA